MSKSRKLQPYFLEEPALLHLPAHKATREETKRFLAWVNGEMPGLPSRPTNWNASVRKKLAAMRLNVLLDAANALQFPPVKEGDDSPVSVPAYLPGGRSLRLRPLINADRRGRAQLTYSGEDEDSRLYVALMSLSYAKPLDWVRECETCRSWFMATRQRDRFCSTLCRVKWYARTPAGQLQRAEYMRKYRATLREIDQKQFLKGKRQKITKGILAKLGK